MGTKKGGTAFYIKATEIAENANYDINKLKQLIIDELNLI